MNVDNHIYLYAYIIYIHRLLNQHWGNQSFNDDASFYIHIANVIYKKPVSTSEC